MKKKIIYYVRRYGIAEIAGILGALICGTLIYHITDSKIATAFAGTWGENLGFYGTIISREIYSSHQKHRTQNLRYTFLSFLKNLRTVVLEFGLSEVMDSFIIRPFLIYTSTMLFSPLVIAILIGKLSADIIFYLLAIFSHETSSRLFKGGN